MRGGKKVVVEPHRHSGVFIARGKEDALVTKNLTPGDTVSISAYRIFFMCPCIYSTVQHFLKFYIRKRIKSIY